MTVRNKIYFASDFHLGAPSYEASRERERRIVGWLDSISHDAAELFLMGDVFDFWFEYASVIPKGFIRLQGKLAQMADAGVKLYFFKGNHDMWVFDYFQKELGMTIVSDDLVIERSGKLFFLHHGDGLGPGDAGYKILKKFFRSKFCQWLFARLHPNLGVGIANRWSRKSRAVNERKEDFKNREQEWLVSYSEELLKTQHFDYLVFGHRHLPLDLPVGTQSRYINLGEWMNFDSYAVFDGEQLELKYFDTNSPQ